MSVKPDSGAPTPPIADPVPAHFRRAGFAWDLYKGLADEDAYALESLRIPVANNEPEFEHQLIYLSKLLIDSLNERMIQQELGDKVANEKGIDELERWHVKKWVSLSGS